MANKKAEEIVGGAEEVSWSTEGRQVVQQIMEEAKHVLQTAKERAATIEAEGEQRAQEIIEEAKKISQATAEEEAQRIIQRAKEEAEEEAQRIIQRAREEAEQEAQGIIQRAREEAEKETQGIIQRAREEAEQETQGIIQKAREEAEQETQGIIQKAREEAEQETQGIIQKAREEAQHITQAAREETEAVIAKKNELVGVIKGIQEQSIAISEMAQQIVATHSEGEEAVEAVESEAPPTTEELPPPYTEVEEEIIAMRSEEGAATPYELEEVVGAIEPEAQPATEEPLPQYTEEAEETIVMESEDGITLYKGELELIIGPASEASQLVEFQKQLQEFPEIKVLRTIGSRDEGGLIGIKLENPTPLIDMLKEIPGVEEAVHEPQQVRGRGFAFKRIRSKHQPKQPVSKRILISLESQSHD